MENEKIRPVKIISDHTDAKEKKLAFGFENYANAIAELIATKNNKTPFTLGISGEWGAGKTTLMKAVEDKLKEEFNKENGNGDFRRVKTVWFQSWKYKDEDEVLAALLDVILKEMKKNTTFWEGLGDKADKIVKSINTRKLISFLTSKTIQVDLTQFFDELKGDNADFKDFLSFYDTFKETFEELLWKYLGVNKKGVEDKRDEHAALVIFIDDMDRCPAPKIIKMLETIKLFMDHPGCVFVLGAARGIIEKALENETKYSKTDAVEFLDKIIQINFPLPKKIKDNSEKFIKDLEEKLDAKLDDEILKIIFPVMENNPRKIITLFNDVSLHTRIFEHENHESVNITFEKLILWKTLEKYDRVFFNREIIEWENYELFREDIGTYGQITEEEKKDDEKAKKALNKPDLLRYLKDGKTVPLINALSIEKNEHNVLATHSISIQEEKTEEERREEEREYTLENEKDFPEREDYKEFVHVEGGEYDLEDIGRKEIKPFEIGKYPVTNRWFEEFIRAGGYNKKEFWSDEGWKWKNDNSIKEPEYWNDKKFNHPAQPAVGVCWYEAEAFCKWLSKESGKKYRLPNEFEWQAAAGGKEGRKYPWGNEWDKNKCNNGELDIGRTTKVGFFSTGKTPDNIYDIAGNVWEWTNTKNEHARFMRGGGWGYVAERCRVADRLRYHAGYRRDDIGFRLALSL